MASVAEVAAEVDGFYDVEENDMGYKCECCGNYTLLEESCGTDNICPVCYWQDDYVQLHNPAFAGGANKESLNQARENYKVFGVCSKEYTKYVRNPYLDELPENNSN